jgi:hypothetical protein
MVPILLNIVRTRNDLPRKPEYQRLLLARGEIHQTPQIYVVKWYPVVDRAESLECQWTWATLSTVGLSILSGTQNRESLYNLWIQVADKCRLNLRYFDSLRFTPRLEWPIGD